MAKPIRATPTLRGKDATKFLKEWIKEINNPSKKRIDFIKNAEKNKKFYYNQLWVK
jgi:hypothetical protein